MPASRKSGSRPPLCVGAKWNSSLDRDFGVNQDPRRADMGGGVSKHDFDDARFERQIRDLFQQDPAHCEQVLKKAAQIVEKEKTK